MTANASRDEIVAEVHQFASLVRARIAGVTEDEDADGRTQSERLWNDTYGRVQFEASNLDELRDQATDLVWRKLAGATALAIQLALRVADAEHRTLMEVLDDAERDVTAGIEQM